MLSKMLKINKKQINLVWKKIEEILRFNVYKKIKKKQ